MTQKTRITKDLDEIMEYLDIDQATLREAVQAGIKRLIKPEIDTRIDAFLHSDPENKTEV